MLEVDLHQAPYEVDDLDAAACLQHAREADLQSRVVERTRLRLALQFCRVHEVSDPDQAGDWGEALGGPWRDCDLQAGGPGTPMVAAHVAAELGAAFSVTTQSAMQLMSDALNLAHRLPLLHAQVEDLRLPGWKARKVAQATYNLSVEACAFVDQSLAERARGFGLVTLDNITAIAIARFHPELLAGAEEAGKEGWGVELEHPRPGQFAGTSELTATGDTLALTRFHELVCTIAAALGRLGDTDSLNVRKAKALDIIADPEAVIDLLTRAENTDTPDDTDPQDNPRPNRAGGSGNSTPRPSTGVVGGLVRKPGRVKLHIHLSDAALAGLAAETGESYVVGEVEKFGPATITPVIDLNRTDARDAHDPPEWMRQLVILRDRHCVFPWCARNARSCDLDHIEPYVHGTNGNRAPPGQSRADNLAPLCRHHHRIKTFAGWSYRRTPDGSYRWKDPYGNTYLVTTNGTHNLRSH